MKERGDRERPVNRRHFNYGCSTHGVLLRKHKSPASCLPSQATHTDTAPDPRNRRSREEPVRRRESGHDSSARSSSCSSPIASQFSVRGGSGGSKRAGRVQQRGGGIGGGSASAAPVTSRSPTFLPSGGASSRSFVDSFARDFRRCVHRNQLKGPWSVTSGGGAGSLYE